MSNGNHIIRAVGRKTDEDSNIGETETDTSEAVLETEDADPEYAEYEYEDEFETSSDRFGWLLPSLAVLTVLAWTGLYGWALRADLAAAASAAPAQWTRWIIDWSVPVLLVGIVWLIAMRNSRAEAQRFANTASMLSHESAQLEKRLNVVNRELSLAREFLGAQSRELESLGRVASEKISAHAAELQSLIADNGQQVDRIGTASETALGNMTRLRDDLPVVANSARDVSNQVGNAGRTAQDQLGKLVAGFERLNEFGKASENQVTALGKQVGNTLGGFETQLARIENLVGARFASLQTEAGKYRADVSSAEETALAALNERVAKLRSDAAEVSAQLREAEEQALDRFGASKDRFGEEVKETIASIDELDQQAVSAAQNRIAELHSEAGRFDDMMAQRDARFLEEIERRQAQFETREAQATEVLAQRLSDLDEAIADRREAQTAETEKLVAHGQTITEQLEKLGVLIAKVSEHSETAHGKLSEGLGTLEGQLEEKRAALGETESQLSDLTEAGIRLLEIIQSGAKHSREDLPVAIQAASEKLSSVEQRAAALNGVMFRTTQHGNELSDYLIKTEESINKTDSAIEGLQAKLAEHSDDTLAKLQGLRSGFAKLNEETSALAGESQDALRSSLAKLEDATGSVFNTLETGTREKVGALSESIGSEAVHALERSLRNESAETIGKLEQAAAHASGVGREAAIQLRDQLSKVNELTGNLEQRVARARELAEEQVNNDFARRMSLITDSLNSNAIDIASALSHEVSDTSWDAYLKGDRGIFTRRAVNLIDSSEAREIADLYQNDDGFKANVSRYIHDFEKMLRSMLSTRDGNALSVTLLGSDMGKLYVVLAQAIERFRN